MVLPREVGGCPESGGSDEDLWEMFGAFKLLAQRHDFLEHLATELRYFQSQGLIRLIRTPDGEAFRGW